jgi:hypothetical protein
MLKGARQSRIMSIVEPIGERGESSQPKVESTMTIQCLNAFTSFFNGFKSS